MPLGESVRGQSPPSEDDDDASHSPVAPTKTARRRRTSALRGAEAVLARGAAGVCGLLQLAILVRLLEEDQYGLFVVVTTLAGYASFVMVEPIVLGFQRWPGTISGAQGNSYRTASSMLAMWATAVCAVAVIGATTAGRLRFVLPLLLWGVSLALLRLTSAAWLMWGRPRRFNLLLVLSTASRVVAMAVTAMVHPDAPDVIAVGAITGIAVAVGNQPWRTFNRSAESSVSRGTLLRTGLPLCVGALGVGSLAMLDRVVLPKFVGLGHLAVYAAQASLTWVLLGASIGLVVTYGYPAVYRSFVDAGEMGARVHSHRIVRRVAIVLYGLIVLATALSQKLTQVALGDEFAGWVTPTVMTIGFATLLLGQIAGWEWQLRLDLRRAAVAGCASVLVMVTVLLATGATLDVYAGGLSVLCGAGAYAAVMLRRSTYVVAADTSLSVALLLLMGVAISVAAGAAPSALPGTRLGVGFLASVLLVRELYREKRRSGAAS